MLHTQTVERETVELLKSLMEEPLLANFALAGGTALSLLLGHRKSIDLDLFGRFPYDIEQMRQLLTDKYDFRESYSARNTLSGTIQGIKVDCITHNYPVLDDEISEDGLRLYSLHDIAAMKLSAVRDNGTRLKDYVDIAYMSTRLSLTEMLDCYGQKYNFSNRTIALKALTYFNDINFQESINLTHGNFDWQRIQKRINSMVETPAKRYRTAP